MNWSMWSVDRVLILFVSLAFLLIGIQVTLFHYRQNFNQKVMWAPVISAPIYFIVGVILACYYAPWLHTTFMVLMWIGTLSGLIGFFYHVRGVRVRVGGWTLRNFLTGPPVMLPLMYAALGVLGLIAFYWKVR